MALTTGVSFAATPMAEVSERAAAIEALGWREVGRANPWVISFQKDVPEDAPDPEAEVRTVMADYWLTAGEIRNLLDRS
jgi:hypothetical protein